MGNYNFLDYILLLYHIFAPIRILNNKNIQYFSYILSVILKEWMDFAL